MSRAYSNKVVPSKVATKFCKVCFDLKKTKEEYESHYVRETPEPTSKVTCPVLLSMECTYCGGNGHTVKYCKALANEKKQEARFQKKIENEKINKIKDQETSTKRPANPMNIFAALCDDSSDSDTEQKQKQKKVKKAPLVLTTSNAKTNSKKVAPAPQNLPGKLTNEDFPQLASAKPVTKLTPISFSSIAIQVYQEQEQERLDQEEADLLARLEEINKKKQEAVQPKTIKPVFLPTVKKENVIPKATAVSSAPSTVFALPITPQVDTTSRSLFDRSDYLDMSDEEDEPEIQQINNRNQVVYNSADFDEDW
jgi:hypothetical protein